MNTYLYKRMRTLYICIYTCMRVCIDLYVCVCGHTYILLYIYLAIYLCMYVYIYIYTGSHGEDPAVCIPYSYVCRDMFGMEVSFAKEPCKRDDMLQKRPMILRSLLIVATPYV